MLQSQSQSPTPTPTPNESQTAPPTADSAGSAGADAGGFRLFSAFRQTFRSGYSRADLRADILAGCVVGVVALPLSMALAIASGVPPQNGLYTAIVAGALISIFGGSRFQVSGPTAAFVVILLPIVSQHGLAGLLMATLMAGVILIFLGAMGLGQLIRFIPSPVVTGFTTGIAFVIASIQLTDALGIQLAHAPENSLERLAALAGQLGGARWADMLIAGLTLAILIFLPRLTRKIPAPLVALPVAAGVALALDHFVPGTGTVATIQSKFSFTAADGTTLAGIPGTPPMPIWPWEQSDAAHGALAVNLDTMRALLMPAIAIALLGAIESLLSAVVADGMTGTQHDPDSELVAQGIGNLVAPFFGGIAATGALARTATNIRSGARSPIAGIVHAGVVLVAMLALSPLLGYLPMAALAALLLLVAYNMSEIKHFWHMMKIAPRGDVAVLLICFALTVVFDMVVAITVGVVLAALMFMRRMETVTGATLVRSGHPALPADLPSDVLVYEIAGPLFFGAAQKAMSSLKAIGSGLRVVVLDMSAVPVMDGTGVVNLESTIRRLQRSHLKVILVGVNPQPAELLAKAGLKDDPGKLRICATLAAALPLLQARGA